MTNLENVAPWDEGFQETELTKALRENHEEKESAALQGGRTLKTNDLEESKSKNNLLKARASKYGNLRAYLGYELKANSNFVNIVDAKPLDPYSRFFQVSPSYFARRSMMKTATVRKLVAERKLPRIYDGDYVRVIVSAKWLGGLPGEDAWTNFTFEPEDAN